MCSSLETFSRSIATLLPTVGSTSFPVELVNLLNQLVSFNNSLILVYSEGKEPHLAFSDLPSSKRRINVNQFLKGAYLLDPCYRAIVENEKSGFYRLRDIVPNGFSYSEYFRSYYRYTGLTDEFGYLIKLSDTTVINISLGRTNTSQQLSDSGAQLLRDIYPAIEGLAHQHWGSENQGNPLATLHDQLECALENFGRSELSKRETEVVYWFLQGYSSRAIGEKLGISPDTVKLHRKKIYAKLDISTQGELFHMFIDSLASVERYVGGDPLVGYLSHVSNG